MNHEPALMEILENLSLRISNQITLTPNHGLLGGLSGQLLFLYKCHELNPSFVSEESIAYGIEKIQSSLQHQSVEMSTGIVGQAWLLEYLNQSQGNNYQSDLLEDVDAFLVERLKKRDFQWANELEYVSGISGFAPYISRRSRHTNQQILQESILDIFEKCAEILPGKKLTWSQPENSTYRFGKGGKEYNLGLAHGVPSIISAVLSTTNSSSLSSRAEQLIIGACNWLLECRLNNNNHSCYPIVKGNSNPSRLGWCYGDLSLALLFARVGVLYKKTDFIDEAIKLGLHASTRNSESARIFDAGICHGYFGLSTMFQALDKLIPNENFKQAQIKWMEYGLERYKKEGVPSFYAYDADNDKHFEEFGLLMGYSGVGLSIISFLTDDIDWFDSLLMA